ncbi:hypothetical protein D3C73_1138500 [compost metagenome]
MAVTVGAFSGTSPVTRYVTPVAGKINWDPVRKKPVWFVTATLTDSSAWVAALGSSIPTRAPHSRNGRTVLPLIVVAASLAVRTNSCSHMKPAYL